MEKKVPHQIGQVTQTEEKNPRKNKRNRKKKGGNHSQESNKRKLEVIIYKWIYVYFIVH